MAAEDELEWEAARRAPTSRVNNSSHVEHITGA